GTDRNARHGVLGERGSKHALRPELLEKPASRTLDRLVVVDIKAKYEYARVEPHFLGDRLPQRVRIGQQPTFMRWRRHLRKASRLQETGWLWQTERLWLSPARCRRRLRPVSPN